VRHVDAVTNSTERSLFYVPLCEGRAKVRDARRGSTRMPLETGEKSYSQENIAADMSGTWGWTTQMFLGVCRPDAVRRPGSLLRRDSVFEYPHRDVARSMSKERSA